MTPRRSLIVAAAGALAAIGAASAAAQSSRPPTSGSAPTLYVITDQEGYGTGECLERQGGCGKIIADSFCESKGFKGAVFYRKAAADDVTGTIASEKKPPPRDPLAFVIACR